MALVIPQHNTCQQPKTATIKKRIGFDPIDRNFWTDPNLKNSEIKVLGYLASNSDSFLPSIRSIARIIKKGINTVARALKKLEIMGYIKRTKRRGLTSIYDMLNSPIVPKMGAPKTGTYRNSNSKEKHTIIHDGEAPSSSKKKNSSHSARKLRKSRAKTKITYNGVSKTLKVWAINMANSVNRRGKWVDYQELNDFFFGLIEKYGSKSIEWIDRSDSVGLFTRRATLDMPWNKLLSDIELSIAEYEKM